MLHAKLRDELSHEYGGEDKCPWSAIEIKGTMSTVLNCILAIEL